jgi:uncharacterized protein DUF4203
MPQFDPNALLSSDLLEKIYLGLLIVIGLVMCFRGYRTFKVVLALLGVLTGAYAGMAAGLHVGNGNFWVGLGGCVALAALGGLLMFAMYLLAVFVLGAGLGVSIAAAATAQAGPEVQAVAIGVLALLGGILALVLQRVVITLATAFNGSLLATSSGWMIWRGISLAEASKAAAKGNSASLMQSQQEQFVILGIWLALGLIGAIAQFAAGTPKPQLAGETRKQRGAPVRNAYYDDRYYDNDDHDRDDDGNDDDGGDDGGGDD